MIHKLDGIIKSSHQIKNWMTHVANIQQVMHLARHIQEQSKGN